MKGELLLHRSALGASDDIRPEPSISPAYGLNRKMPIEVMRDFDTTLLFGRLAEAGPMHLRIEQGADERSFPILTEGCIVLIRGYDTQMAPVILWTMVVESSQSRCTVENLGRIYHQTERKLVRYPVCPPSAAQILDDGRPEPSLLINISLGGACIVSKQLYAVDQSLHIRFGPAEDSAFYPCQVVRITPRWGKLFEYGLRFLRLNGAQSEHLAQEIQVIQEITGKNLASGKKYAGTPDRDRPERR